MHVKNSLTFSFNNFLNSQKFSGILLLGLTVLSLIIANSFYGPGYILFWHHPVNISYFDLNFSIGPEKVVNEILMAFFFLLVGLEIKREALVGELSGFAKASLPVAAALGGMIVPALLYYSVNYNSETSSGWGIPMATDIAFVIGIISLIGKRIPESLKVILTALAVVDDLGAIIVIALFYSSSLSATYLIFAAIIITGLILLNTFKVHSILPFLLLGILLWYCIYKSGIHSTISGVILAMTIPHRRSKSLLTKLEENLHSPVNFIIMPLFVLCNTAMVIDFELFKTLRSDESIGIALGLIIGKPVGITLFTWLAVKAGISRLPENLRFRHVIGTGFLGGIGFTMSIFISLLAFNSEDHVRNAKLMILCSSFAAGLIGYLLLKYFFKNNDGNKNVDAGIGQTIEQS